MQIVVLDGYAVSHGELTFDALKAFGTVSVYDRTPPELVVQRLRGADAAFVNKIRLSADVLESARTLRFVGVLATGYDIVDMAAAKRQRIVVCNVPAYSTAAVAQATVALLLEITHHVGYYSGKIRQGAWSGCPDFSYYERAPVELDGMTLGLLGLGAIGSRVAQMGRALGMRVIGHSLHEHPEFPGEQVPLPQLLRESDVLSLHCPATAQTTGVINRHTIADMKDGAILINTARGALVNEQDLADALRSGKLAAAGLDVASREPISKSNPLLTAPNCVITGHYAWATRPARERLLAASVENLAAFLRGEPQNVVL